MGKRRRRDHQESTKHLAFRLELLLGDRMKAPPMLSPLVCSTRRRFSGLISSYNTPYPSPQVSLYAKPNNLSALESKDLLFKALFFCLAIR